jgi:hypothetical protein
MILLSIDLWLTGSALATGRFWPETLATPASTSTTVDLGLFFPREIKPLR